MPLYWVKVCLYIMCESIYLYTNNPNLVAYITQEGKARLALTSYFLNSCKVWMGSVESNCLVLGFNKLSIASQDILGQQGEYIVENSLTKQLLPWLRTIMYWSIPTYPHIQPTK